MVMERKHCCVVVLLPTVILLLLFLVSQSRPHWLWQPLHSPSPWDRPQLTTHSKALALLGHQQAQLLAELHSTTEPISHTYFVKQQLTVNEQLQRLLTPSSYGDAASEMATASPCQKIARVADALATRGGIPWQPSEGRYLVMICDSGQLSNHLMCLQKHIYFGALLNRTLVLPHGSLDYKYEHLLDIAHLKNCLGNASIATFDEFEEAKNKKLHVDKLICYMPGCYFDTDHQSKWEALGFTFGTKQDAWASFPILPTHRGDILARFVCEEHVIAVGDLFYAEVEDSLKFAVAHPCRNPMQANANILVTAQRFVQTYLGGNFLAVHFRRHGFLVFCNKQRAPSCFYPIPQAARCIHRKLRESRAEVIYLSTDAPASEVQMLRQQLGGVAVVTRTEVHEAEAKWDSVLWRKGLESEPAVMAMVDKAICAMAVAFVGTRESTFSHDIQRMRYDMASDSSCDAPLCNGQLPSFVAQLP